MQTRNQHLVGAQVDAAGLGGCRGAVLPQCLAGLGRVGQPALQHLLLAGLALHRIGNALAQVGEQHLLRRLDPGRVQGLPVAVQHHQVIDRHLGLVQQRLGTGNQGLGPGAGAALGHCRLQPLLGEAVDPPVMAAELPFSLQQGRLRDQRLHGGQFDVEHGGGPGHGQQGLVVAGGGLQAGLPLCACVGALAGTDLGLGLYRLLGFGPHRCQSDRGGKRRSRRLPFFEKPAQHGVSQQ